MCGDVVTVKVEGPDEEIASKAIYDFMEKNL
jgi:phosphotransferase system HPr-like phosphotransfer protein